MEDLYDHFDRRAELIAKDDNIQVQETVLEFSGLQGRYPRPNQKPFSPFEYSRANTVVGGNVGAMKSSNAKNMQLNLKSLKTIQDKTSTLDLAHLNASATNYQFNEITIEAPHSAMNQQSQPVFAYPLQVASKPPLQKQSKKSKNQGKKRAEPFSFGNATELLPIALRESANSTMALESIINQIHHQGIQAAEQKEVQYNRSQVFSKKHNDIVGRKVDGPQIIVPESVQEKTELKNLLRHSQNKQTQKNPQNHLSNSLSPPANSTKDVLWMNKNSNQQQFLNNTIIGSSSLNMSSKNPHKMFNQGRQTQMSKGAHKENEKIGFDARHVQGYRQPRVAKSVEQMRYRQPTQIKNMQTLMQFKKQKGVRHGPPGYDEKMATKMSKAEVIGDFLDIQMEDKHNSQNQMQECKAPKNHQQTLNILSANQMKNSKQKEGQKVKSKSVLAENRHGANQGRNLIQTKYLNFQRDVTNNKRRDNSGQEGSNKRGQSKKHQLRNTIQATSHPRGVQNPFGQIQSSNTKVSGGTISACAKTFVNKNQTLDVDMRRRSQTRQGTSLIFSDSPDKESAKPRARSGGDSNFKSHESNLGMSTSLSPKSRKTTNFIEARSLLMENQSSGKSRRKQLSSQGRSSRKSRKHFERPHMIAASSNQISALRVQNNEIFGAQIANNASVSVNHGYNKFSVENLQSSGDPSSSNLQASAKYMGSTCVNINRGQNSRLDISTGKILGANFTQKKQTGSQSPKENRNTQNVVNQLQRPVTFLSGVKIQSAGNTAKIDRIIQENLKKQNKKSQQQKLKEQHDEMVNRKRKVQLEEVNERVRKANQEKVQRRKNHQQLLQQTNAKDQLTLEKNLQTLLARNDKDTTDISNEMNKMLEAISDSTITKTVKRKDRDAQKSRDHFDKIMGGENGVKQQLQAQEIKEPPMNQNLEVQFNSQQRMDGIMSKLGQNVQHQPLRNRKSGSNPRSKEPSQLLPSALKVNRLQNLNQGKDCYDQVSRQKDLQQKIRHASPVEQKPEEESLNELKAKLFEYKQTNRMENDHRRSFGLEFIDIRKEIVHELKQINKKCKNDQNMSTINAKKPRKEQYFFRKKDINDDIETRDKNQNLKISKSHREIDEINQILPDASIKDKCVTVTHPETLQDEARFNILRFKTKTTGEQNKSLLNKNEGTVVKKERIRKFMKNKQKALQEQNKTQRQEQIEKTMKVQANLLKLDKFAKKRFKPLQNTFVPSTGKAAMVQNVSLRQPRVYKENRKNVTLVHDQNQSIADHSIFFNPQNMTITPQRRIFENSEPPYNVSENQERKLYKIGTRPDSRTENELHKHARIHEQSMAEHSQSQLKDGGSSTRVKQRKHTGNRRDFNQQANANQLAPQFENSNSAKTLRAQLRQDKQHSLSPPREDKQNTSKILINKKQQGQKSNRQALQLAVQTGQPTKDLKQMKKNQKTKKRNKSSQKQNGPTNPIFNPQGVVGRLNVKIPDVIFSKPGRIDQSRRSIQTLESGDSAKKRSRSHSMNRDKNLLNRQKQSSYPIQMQEIAASVIQKEVRRFLKQLGFYEAREIHSPEKPQISLFIEKRNQKSRSGSRSRKSIKVYEKNADGSERISRKTSPENLSINFNNPQLQETTVIVELSGYKNHEIFGDYEEDEAQSEPQSHIVVQPNSKEELVSHQVSQELSQIKVKRTDDRSSGKKHQNSSNKQSRASQSKRRQQSISSDQDQQKQSKKKSVINGQPKKDKKPPKELKHVAIENQQPPKDKPVKERQLHLNKDIKVQRKDEISVIVEQQDEKTLQTPKSRSDKINKDGNAQSLSAAPISSQDSEFDLQQLQSVASQEILVIPNQIDAASQSSNSLFNHNAFQQYSNQKLKEIIQKSEHSKLIQFREEILRYKENSERKRVRKAFIQNEYSPKTFKDKNRAIDRWVQIERREIEKTKTNFQEEWDKTVQMIEFTQKNVDQMRSKINQNVSSSGHKISKNSNYHSQSAQSLNINMGQLASTDQNRLKASGNSDLHQKSILIEDPPKSYRSGRQEVARLPILPVTTVVMPELTDDVGQGSMGVLSSRRSAKLTDNLMMANTLLQDMEQKLAEHKEKQLQNRQNLRLKENDFEDHELEKDIIVDLPSQASKNNVLLEQHGSKLHSRGESLTSGIESDLSHQPSAEFIERLEKVNKLDPFVFNQVDEKKLNNLQFAPDGVVHATEDNASTLLIQENRFSDQRDKPEPKQKEASNFKNNVITIKDFSIIDSKRTSGQSEFSNEEQFMRMIEESQKRNLQREAQEDSHAAFEEPKIYAQATTLRMDPSNESLPSAESNIKAGDLTNQSKEKTLTNLEPQIQTSDDSEFKLGQPVPQPEKEANADLIQVQVKPSRVDNEFELTQMLKDPKEQKKLVDKITDDLMRALISESISIPDRTQKRQKLEIPKSHPNEGSNQAQQQMPQQQQHDVYLIDHLSGEREEKKEWIEIRQRHLIENDLIRLDQYCNEIVDALLQFEIDYNSEEEEFDKTSKEDNYHVQFLKQLTKPIVKNSLATLQNLQTSEIGSYQHFETVQDLQKHPIIPVDLYLEIEKAREVALLAKKKDVMNKQTQLVWESIHIQNKCFFDAVNESLMKFRPYGLTGEPMPWSNKVRRLQTKVEIHSVDTERLFQMVKQEVFRWAQAFCGAVPSPVFCFPSANRKDEFNEDLLQENREKRLNQILSAETVEQEHHWLNYEYEEAQVKIDLSDMILEHLVEELTMFLNSKMTDKCEVQTEQDDEPKVRELFDEPEFA